MSRFNQKYSDKQAKTGVTTTKYRNQRKLFPVSIHSYIAVLSAIINNCFPPNGNIKSCTTMYLVRLVSQKQNGYLFTTGICINRHKVPRAVCEHSIIDNVLFPRTSHCYRVNIIHVNNNCKQQN